MSMYRCCNCGKLFEGDEIDSFTEYRGECHGFPAYETVACSPCCHDDFEEVDCDEEGIYNELTIIEDGDYVEYTSDWYYNYCSAKCDGCKFYKESKCLWEA